MKRLRRGLCLLAGAVALTALPRLASADLPAERVDFGMYGRVGMAWTPSGQVIHGRTMNLTGSAIGGRLEEGDYLEPTLKFHILKGKEEKDPNVDAVLTFGMFSRRGSFIDLLSSNEPGQVLGMEVFQAYAEGRNVFVPGLTVWGGARFYRGSDVHIADYFFFNQLNGQGAGVKYKGLDTAVLLQTGTSGLYAFDTDGDGEPDLQRQRTVFVGQYTHEFSKTVNVQGLAELHVLPGASRGDQHDVADGDFGWVVGAKLHLDLDKGAFNDLSVKYGARIANGALGGSSSFYTFGNPSTDGTYGGAYGVELVDHFLWNFGQTLSLNAYATGHIDRGASDAPEDKAFDFAVGARTFLYAHKNFHLINEATFQTLKRGDLDMGTAVKVSVVPTIVPTGEQTAWARPHIRLIYTVGFYNDAAVDQLMSPFLQAYGRTKSAHYLGTRAEWWF